MGKGIASNYTQPEITICENCIHKHVCGNRDYLTENQCCDFLGWISVEEKLPEDDTRVLVCATIVINDSKTNLVTRQTTQTAKFIFGKDECYFCTPYGWHVTHWMPSPKLEGV